MALTTRQGLPKANTFGGISLVTTLPAPITEPCPIFTPGKTTTLPPSYVLSPISIGIAFSKPWFRRL